MSYCRLIVKEQFRAMEVNIDTESNIEYVATCIEHQNKCLIIVNVYLPPYSVRLRCIMIRELETILNKITRAYPLDELIILGDFNSSGILWDYVDEGSPFLLSISDAANDNERLFIEIMSPFSLFQIDNTPNENGKYLDLIFVSNVNVNTTAHAINDNEAMDNFTRHHK